jgi:hypothetical protein
VGGGGATYGDVNQDSVDCSYSVLSFISFSASFISWGWSFDGARRVESTRDWVWSFCDWIGNWSWGTAFEGKAKRSDGEVRVEGGGYESVVGKGVSI